MSRLMETEPVGLEDTQPFYYNRLVRGGYNGTARELLKQCLAIEKKLGRTRHEKFAPRTADIDILLFGKAVTAEADLHTAPTDREPPFLRGRAARDRGRFDAAVGR